MSVFKKLAGQTAVYGLLTIVARFINYLLVPIHTAYLAIGSYGVVSDMYSIVALAMVILTYGMETTFFSFTRKNENLLHTFKTSLSILHLSTPILIIVGLLFRENIATALDYPGQSQYVVYMLIILAFDALSSIPLAYLRRQNKAWKFTLIRVSGIILSVLLNIYLIVICPWLLDKGYSGFYNNFYNPNSLIDYIFIANAISSIWVYLCVLPIIFKTKMGIDKALAKKILKYTWPLLFVGMAGIVNETFDRILLRRMLVDGDYQTGVYSAFYKLSIVITLMIQAFRMGAEPFFFSQLEAKNKEKTYAIILKYFVHACVIVFVLTSLFAEPLARILIRKEGFFEHKYGLMIVPILLMANVFLGMYYNISIWYKGNDQTYKGAIMAIIGATITLILNLSLIPMIGILGSAIATFFCYGIMVTINYHWGQKHLKVPYPMWRIITILISAAILVAVYYLTTYNFELTTKLQYTLAAALGVTYILTWILIEKKEFKQLL